MKILIRKAKRRDVKKIAEVITKSFLETARRDCTKKKFEDYLGTHSPKKSGEELFDLYLRGAICFVAEANGEIVGIGNGVVENGRGRVSLLFVLPEYFRKGIGRKLMKRLEEYFIRNNVRYSYLRSSSLALAFYQDFGYKKTSGMKKSFGIKYYPMKKVL